MEKNFTNEDIIKTVEKEINEKFIPNSIKEYYEIPEDKRKYSTYYVKILKSEIIWKCGSRAWVNSEIRRSDNKIIYIICSFYDGYVYNDYLASDFRNFINRL